ncbi:MAG: helix-turn-helix transcriptional regulator [bacterium]
MTNNVHRLKVARTAAGLNQFDLAKRAGCSETVISKIETGRLTPAPDLKAKIATVLGKPAFELFTQ